MRPKKDAKWKLFKPHISLRLRLTHTHTHTDISPVDSLLPVRHTILALGLCHTYVFTAAIIQPPCNRPSVYELQ